jgi:hypothetical protein
MATADFLALVMVMGAVGAFWIRVEIHMRDVRRHMRISRNQHGIVNQRLQDIERWLPPSERNKIWDGVINRRSGSDRRK